MRTIIFSRPFLSLAAQNFLAFSGLNIFNVIPDYLSSLGASRSYIGMFMNINSLVLVLLVIPLSRYTDHFGRKQILVVGYLSAMAALILSFLFPLNLGALLLFRVLGSLAFCAFFTIHGAEVFEIIPRDRRMAGMGIFGISGLLSNPVSAFIGETTSRLLGARWIFVASLGFMALACAVAVRHQFHKPAQPAQPGAFIGLFKRPEIAPLVILALLMGGGFTIYASFLANLTRERLGVVSISIFFTTFALVAIFSRLFLSVWLEGIRKSWLAAASFGLIAVSFVASFFLQSAWQLIPIGLIFGFGFSIVSPLMASVFVNTGGEHEKLALNNLYVSINTLGNIVFAIGLGALGDWLGLPMIFLAMGIITVVALPVALRGIKVPYPAQDPRDRAI